MATHVYANGQEIACKATDGTAPAAFPDPCWSPPPPPAGPVVIPYANFTTASKIRNGTRSVFIKGQTVALENKSYFVNSTGNEPATYAFGKGLMTGALKGKAYFQSWSLNVVFEGRGVARNLDVVTHNHGSDPSNTAPFPYISRKSPEDVELCAKDKEKIEANCGPKPEVNNNEKKGTKKWHWTDDHCAGLEDKLKSYQAAENYAKKFSADGKYAGTIGESRLTQEFKTLRDAVNTKVEMRSKDHKKAIDDALGIAARQQEELAENNCIRARKCHLVPYSRGKRIDGREPSTGKGCCKGQTGHHLICDAMVKHASPECTNYDGKTAPTVCVEGASQDFGSHRRIHAAMDKNLTAFANGKDSVSLDNAIKAAVNSHKAAFPKAGCSDKCLEAQLKTHYSKMCNGKKLKVKISRKRNLSSPDGGSEIDF